MNVCFRSRECLIVVLHSRRDRVIVRACYSLLDDASARDVTCCFLSEQNASYIMSSFNESTAIGLLRHRPVDLVEYPCMA